LIRSLPNLLSLTRLCLVPAVLYYIWNRQYQTALIWGLVASATDALDGFLARVLNAQTRFGAYLDPVADKLLLSGVYLFLALRGAIPWWLAVVVFGRDALMLLAIGCLVVFTKLREFPPSMWGKLSTAAQILTALLVLLTQAGWLGRFPHLLERPFMFFTAAATSWSAVHYFWRGRRMLRSLNQDSLHHPVH
jgi:cardiolipin synthase